MSTSSSLTTAAQNTSRAPAPTRWGALGYQQVPGLANRIISRYLRTQRKTMARFFTERGLFDLAERIRQIRHSRQGMLAKNQMFQEVLNDYSALVQRATPVVAPQAEAANPQGEGTTAVVLHGAGALADRDRSDAVHGVPGLAVSAGNGIVIEE